MQNKVKVVKVSDVKSEPTAHAIGTKKVLIRGEESLSNLTQFAYGTLRPGEKVEPHLHPTMEEVFVFLSGNGIYQIDGAEVPVHNGVVIKIPANTQHALICDGEEILEFYYFGISV